MRTTLNLDDALLERARRLTEIKEKLRQTPRRHPRTA
jgi:hypothetical protein